MRELLRAVGAADVIDVLLVAAFLYVIIAWLRRAGSESTLRRITVAGVLFLAVFLLANSFDLFLVESLLRVLAIVLLLAAVVVFQSDLRRMLDRLGTWSLFRSAASAPASHTVDLLSEVAGKLAETRTGALLAIRGAEPWDTHIQGGVPLDGELSRPLLYSIFAPDSPGHDGAVLIDGDRITKFGAHLPLSGRLPDVSLSGGTRHAAALGLSEECDALVIVVSEERGTISVARNGRLVPVASTSELRRRLAEFWQRHDDGSSAFGERWWGRRSLENAALSLSVAMAAWLVFASGSETVQRTFQVPIAFRNVPPGWVLEHDTLAEARVVLSGPEQAFQLLDPDDLLISLDLEDPEPGANDLIIEQDDMELPAQLRLSDVEPPRFRVVAHRRTALELPIQVRTAGVLPDSVTVVPNPRTVTVLVPHGDEARPDRVFTEPVDPQGLPLGGSVQVELVLPPSMRLGPGEEAEVEVTLERTSG